MNDLYNNRAMCHIYLYIFQLQILTINWYKAVCQPRSHSSILSQKTNFTKSEIN